MTGAFEIGNSKLETLNSQLINMATAEKTTKGTINVSTENIFPIIKKFLYSDHEIFLRELVSNATDATQKLRTLEVMDKVKGEVGDITIEIDLDEKVLMFFG